MNKQLCERNIKRLKTTYCVASFVAFLGGVVIYAFLRDINNMILFHFFPRLPFLSTLYTPIKTDSIWSHILLYNLPDGLWCLSALLLVRAIWLPNIKWCAIYSGIFIALALSFETAQLSANIPGTFDALDLAFTGFFAFAEKIFFTLFIKRSIV